MSLFDYFSPTDFKFAGIDVGAEQGRARPSHGAGLGHRRDGRRHRQPPVGHAGTTCRSSSTASSSPSCVNGAYVLTKQLAPRYIDGQPYGFNKGLVGVGSNNSRGTFDNVIVQDLPPQSTFENTEDFADGVADLFTGGSREPGRSAARGWPARRRRPRAATSVMSLPVRNAGDIEVDVDAQGHACRAAAPAASSSTTTAPSDFKYVTLDLAAGAVVIGHRIRNQWAIDANFASSLSAGVDSMLAISLNGTSVTVSAQRRVVGSFSYYGAVADGGLGTISQTGTTSFDDVHVVIGTHVDSSPDSQPPTLTTPANVTTRADAGKPTTVISRLHARHRDRHRQRRARHRSFAPASRPATSSRSA